MSTHHRRGFRILLLLALSVTISTVVLTGAAAAEFEVNITDVTIISGGPELNPGDDINITANISKDSGPQDTQTIRLIDGGSENNNVIDSKSVKLGSGSVNKPDKNFTWNGVHNEANHSYRQ